MSPKSMHTLKVNIHIWKKTLLTNLTPQQAVCEICDECQQSSKHIYFLLIKQYSRTQEIKKNVYHISFQSINTWFF